MSSRPTLLNSGPPQVDPALAQVGEYTLDAADRQYIDTQVRAIQQYLVDLVLASVLGTLYEVDAGSAALVEGDVVCLSANGTKVTKAVSAALTDAKRALGICLGAGAPGTWVRVASLGVLPATKTGLGAVAGYVRVNTTTARAERVASLSAGDYPLGVVHASGAMSLQPAEVVSSALTGASFAASSFLSVGSPTATSGELRLPNVFSINGRDAANTLNIVALGKSGNDFSFGGGLGNSTEDVGTGGYWRIRENFTEKLRITPNGAGGVEITSTAEDIKLASDTSNLVQILGLGLYLDTRAGGEVALRTNGGGTERLKANDTGIGFFGATPVTRQTYTAPANHTNDRALDETGDTLVQVANVLGTLINDLKALGLLG